MGHQDQPLPGIDSGRPVAVHSAPTDGAIYAAGSD